MEENEGERPPDDGSIEWWQTVGMEQFLTLENVNGNEENRAGTTTGAIPGAPDQQATKAN